MMARKFELQSEIEKILNSRKYRGMNIPPETVRDLLERELQSKFSSKEALKSARHKLHNVMATYLGDPDFEEAEQMLVNAFEVGGEEEIKEACKRVLAAHASTKERQPILEGFYNRLFELTGKPGTILDLACGLHPFSFPWMNLPLSTRYFAYDINAPRVALINRYFELQGLEQLGVLRDILLDPPTQEAEVALIFKEAHRMQQRQPGCNLPFWKALNVKWLLVSLPTSSLSGKHNMLDRQRRLVYDALKDQNWPVTEIMIETEIVFCIDKNYET